MLTILKEDTAMPQSGLCYSWILFLNAASRFRSPPGKQAMPSPCSYWKHDEDGRFYRFSPLPAPALVEQTLGQGLSLQEAEPKSPRVS